MLKPTRKFRIRTGPIVVPIGDTALEVVNPIQEHVVEGVEIKYVFGQDRGFVHIVDKYDSVVFSAPNAELLWIRQEPEELPQARILKFPSLCTEIVDV